MTQKKNKKIIIILILVILALLALLLVSFMLGKSNGKEGSVEPQVNYTEQSMVIEEDTEETSETREGVFKKGGSAKQKTTNADVKGGSETLEIIKPEEEKDLNEDANQNQEDNMLPGIW